MSPQACARRSRCREADRVPLCLVARPRQPPIASARCWPSTRRMSASWKTTKSWPAMWVPSGFSRPGPSKAPPPCPERRGGPRTRIPPHLCPGTVPGWVSSLIPSSPPRAASALLLLSQKAEGGSGANLGFGEPSSRLFLSPRVSLGNPFTFLGLVFFFTYKPRHLGTRTWVVTMLDGRSDLPRGWAELFRGLNSSKEEASGALTQMQPMAEQQIQSCPLLSPGWAQLLS